jgi:hypothetical protein
VATVIQLKSKEDFKKCRDIVKDKSTLSWKMYMWDWFQEETCYYPDEDCLISLTRAKEMGLSVEPFKNNLFKNNLEC